MNKQDKITLLHRILTRSHQYELDLAGVLKVIDYHSGVSMEIDLGGLLDLEGVEDYITTEDEYDEE